MKLPIKVLKSDSILALETPPYTVDEMKFLATHIENVKQEQDRLYLVLQIFHPMRLEEVLGLRWEDIDLTEGVIHIIRAATHPTRNQPEVKELKTEQSGRVIGLSEIAKKYLSSATNRQGFIIGGKKPLSYTQVRSMCSRIQKNTNFDGKITPKRFRTTVLTDLYDVTKDIKLAQHAAGHTSPAMTLKHYVKVRESVSCSGQVINNLYSAS